ncbi:uncharacterized protein LOC129170069 [Dunckerocampus dactyliophorus]|uniref:uncharacterized protein LOC129170069 n=1 Tax=Dunckerocampus dactyliophorus TaxID=161453 RepID=UPI0024056CB7|nr:uncharacterized protein LOC129170069 [Dunckerocampus dactyliophorus]
MTRRQNRRKAGEGKAAGPKKMYLLMAAEPMESGKYMWPTGCVKKYLTSVKKYCYSFIYSFIYCYILQRPVRPHPLPLVAQPQPLLATTAQAGAAADEDFDDDTDEALTQDQLADEEQPSGDDQTEKGRAAAGAEDSDSQHPHFERDDEQRQPQKKSRRKPLLLDNDTQEQLFEWVREHELLWRKGATDYKYARKKTELWTRKARELDIEEGAEAVRTWWKSVRVLYTKLLSKKSGQAAPNLTDRELFIQRNCAFLHKEVKPRKGQPLRIIPLTQEPLASQPPAAQPSASASTAFPRHRGTGRGRGHEGHQCPHGETGPSTRNQPCKAALHQIHVPVSPKTT